MSPTSRRIFFYWLLLLVPTLVVGSGAIFLLRREQARLAERGAYADEARRAAIAARARLIVENVELLLGEVEAGLLDTLAAQPTDELDAELERLEKTNPLVRTAFRASATGQVLWPSARSSNEEARGFLRRFARQFGGQPPWSKAAAEKLRAPEKREQLQSRDESAARREVEANVAQVQSARRDVQELFKNQSLASSSASPAAPVAPSVAVANEVGGVSSVSRPRVAEADRQQGGGRAAADSVATRSAPRADKPLASRAEGKVAPATQTQTFRAKDAATDRRGWTPMVTDGRMHLLGWIQPGGTGDVRGVELEIAA